MPRYATIITADDGAEIVSAIVEFEGASLPQRSGFLEQVAPGVRIGMVRGGLVDAVAGFGFPRQGLGPSAVRTVTAKLKAAPAQGLPISPQAGVGRTERVAVPPTLALGGTATGQLDKALPEQRRAKPIRKPARKVRKAKAAKAAPPDAAAHG